MRIHTNLSGQGVIEAFNRAKAKGLIAHEVSIANISVHRSTKRERGVEVSLGAAYDAPWFISEPVAEYLDECGVSDKIKRKVSIRRPRQSPTADFPKAATWHEWGAFIAEVFERDEAAIVGHYKSIADFRMQTAELFPDQRLAHSGRSYDFMSDAWLIHA